MSSSGWGSIRDKDVAVAVSDLPPAVRTFGPYSSWANLVAGVNAAGLQAGDHFVLQNGTHAKTAQTFTNRSGNAINPVVIRPETVGGATLTGTGLLRFNSCNYMQWYGFNHAHAADTALPIRFDNCVGSRFARNEVALTGSGFSDWFMITSGNGYGVANNNRVDHNYFHSKTTDGTFMALGFGTAAPTNTLIEYNYFTGYTGIGEPIIWGNSTSSPTNYNTIFQHNLIVDNTCVDGEIISIKCSNNSIFHNSFVNNDNGTLTLRHGHFTKIRGNYFDGGGVGGGIVVSGSNHTILRNHFKNMPASGFLAPIYLRNGSVETIPAGQTSTGYERVDNCRIALNSIINGSSAGGSGVMVLWGRDAHSNALKPTNCIFEGNILKADTGTLFDFQDGATSATNTFQNNIAHGSASVGDLLGYTSADPQVTLGSGGLYRIASGSPARNLVASGTYDDYIDADIDGEPTDGVANDAGSDQYSTATVYPLRVINVADVGPNAP